MDGNDDDIWAAGWIPIPRKLRDHPIMQDPAALAAYVMLAFRARRPASPLQQRAPGHKRRIECEVGETVYGSADLATNLSTSRQTIRTALKKLVMWRLVFGGASTNLGSRLTVRGLREFWERHRSKQPTPKRSATEGGNGAGLTSRSTSDLTTNGYLETPKQDQESGRASHDAIHRWGEQELASTIVHIGHAWAAAFPDAEPASFVYVRDGLRLAESPEDLGESVLKLIEETSRDGDGPDQGDSLWAWFCRNTGEWYGCESDVRMA